MSVQAALVAATRRLIAADIPNAAGDVRALMAYALGIARDRLTLESSRALTPTEENRFQGYVDRRLMREPVSHILGRREFYGREFAVNADVLDPRPETEILIEAALQEQAGKILDLGTGSGCILLTLLAETPGAIGTGTDISQAACDVARANAISLGLARRATIQTTDWASGVEGPFDLIVSNPPYIALSEMAGLAPEVRDWEPYGALTDGADGLMAYRAIAEAAPPLLRPGGRLMVEIGPTQGAAVADLFAFVGFEDLRVISDLDGRDRVVSARMPA
ncbi:MAG TPA: peptide chain release factor N(5)-glutamine methyltransferase [Paracoccaceae bacterium]|nr:peptide chain release factor N(5)-glutamine methyltransferase [Paracoccaceae bacterium]